MSVAQKIGLYCAPSLSMENLWVIVLIVPGESNRGGAKSPRRTAHTVMLWFAVERETKQPCQG